MKISRIIRKFERFHFHGITEQPEHVYERDGNMYVSMRDTGKPQSTISASEKNEGEISIGKLTYDFQNDKAVFTYNNENVKK